jgi:hypothetical protein
LSFKFALRGVQVRAHKSIHLLALPRIFKIEQLFLSEKSQF